MYTKWRDITKGKLVFAISNHTQTYETPEIPVKGEQVWHRTYNSSMSCVGNWRLCGITYVTSTSMLTQLNWTPIQYSKGSLQSCSDSAPPHPTPASPMKYLHVWSTSNYKTAVKVLSCFFLFLSLCGFNVTLETFWRENKMPSFQIFSFRKLSFFFLPFLLFTRYFSAPAKKTWVLQIAFPMIHLPSAPSLPSILLMEGGWDPA